MKSFTSIVQRNAQNIADICASICWPVLHHTDPHVLCDMLLTRDFQHTQCTTFCLSVLCAISSTICHSFTVFLFEFLWIGIDDRWWLFSILECCGWKKLYKKFWLINWIGVRNCGKFYGVGEVGTCQNIGKLCIICTDISSFSFLDIPTFMLVVLQPSLTIYLLFSQSACSSISSVSSQVLPSFHMTSLLSCYSHLDKLVFMNIYMKI